MKVVLNSRGTALASTTDAVATLMRQEGLPVNQALRELGRDPNGMPRSFWKALREGRAGENGRVVKPIVDPKPKREVVQGDSFSEASFPQSRALQLNRDQFDLPQNPNLVEVANLRRFLSGGDRFNVTFTNSVSGATSSESGRVSILLNENDYLVYVDNKPRYWTSLGSFNFLKLD